MWVWSLEFGFWDLVGCLGVWGLRPRGLKFGGLGFGVGVWGLGFWLGWSLGCMILGLRPVESKKSRLDSISAA